MDHTVLDVTHVSVLPIMSEEGLQPAVVLVVPDTSPLYDEDVIEVMTYHPEKCDEGLMSERAHRRVDLTVTDLEESTENHLNVLVTAESSYLSAPIQFDIPIVLLKTGIVMQASYQESALMFALEADYEYLGAFDALYRDDVLVTVSMPSEVGEELGNTFHQYLGNLPLYRKVVEEVVDRTKAAVPVALSLQEYRMMLISTVNMFMGLAEGDEDALVWLYEQAELIDQGREAYVAGEELSSAESFARLFQEVVRGLFRFTHPDNVSGVLGGGKRVMNSETVELFGDSVLHETFEAALSAFHRENPSKFNPELDLEGRVKYMKAPTNEVELLHGLVELSDRINMDLLYSEDWNQLPEEATKLHSSEGELIIVQALVVAQRELMRYFSSVMTSQEDMVDSDDNFILDNAAGDIMTSVMEKIIDSASDDDDDDEDAWVTGAAAAIAVNGEEWVLNELLSISCDPEDYSDLDDDDLAEELDGYDYEEIDPDDVPSYHRQLLAFLHMEAHKRDLIPEVLRSMFRMAPQVQLFFDLTYENEGGQTVEELIDMFIEDERYSLEELVTQLGGAVIRFAEFAATYDAVDGLEDEMDVKKAAQNVLYRFFL